MDSGGRHGTAFWRLDSARTPETLHRAWLLACSYARGCQANVILLREKKNKFPYKALPIVDRSVLAESIKDYCWPYDDPALRKHRGANDRGRNGSKPAIPPLSAEL